MHRYMLLLQYSQSGVMWADPYQLQTWTGQSEGWLIMDLLHPSFTDGRRRNLWQIIHTYLRVSGTCTIRNYSICVKWKVQVSKDP